MITSFYQNQKGYTMYIVILNLIGAVSIGIGMFQITDSYTVSIISVIVGNGAPFLWFLHNIWYVLFEFIKLGHLSIYGYIVLIIYVLIISISIITSKRKKTLTKLEIDSAFAELGEK